MDNNIGQFCSVCRNHIKSAEFCAACEGKFEDQEDPIQPVNSDPYGFLGTFGPTQSERAQDEGWEFDEEEIPF